MRKEGEKAMKRIFLLCVAVAIMVAACANEEQSVVLEKFIPVTDENDCKIELDSKYWYDKGYVDVYFSASYPLVYKLVNYMAASAASGQGAPEGTIDSQEANRWQLKKIILSYELPGVPGVDGDAWRRREVLSQAVVDPEGGKAAGSVELFTNEQFTNLQQIFSLFASAQATFDWRTYPIIVTVQAEGVKLGGGDVIRTNKLRFNLVPVYAISAMSRIVYPVDPDWPTDEEIDNDSTMTDAQKEQARYDRDKDIYDTQMLHCAFPTEHLTGGCFPGVDGALVDCHTWEGSAGLIEALYPGYACCPPEEPDEPQEPEAETP